jgi:tetratricopeptide (TPR) repeat protein
MELQYYKLDECPDLIPGKVLAGYAADRPHGEVFTRIKDFSDISRKAPGLRFHGIRIPSSEFLSQPCEIAIGIKPEASDHAGIAMQRAAKGTLPEIDQEEFILLSLICEYVVSAFLELPSYWNGKDKRYSLPSTADFLAAMTTSILIVDHNWESCAFRVYEENAGLFLRSSSPSCPTQPDYLPLDRKQNLESIVFETGDAIIIDDVRDEDPRVQGSGAHVGQLPFAIVPARWKNGIIGTVYVNAISSNQDAPPFNTRNLKLFRLLAGVVAEGYIREHISGVVHLLDSMAPTPIVSMGEIDLLADLRDLIEHHVHGPARIDDGPDENLVLFCINVARKGDEDLHQWYDERICRYLDTDLRGSVSSARFGKAENLTHYILKAGKIISLVKSVSLSQHNLLEIRESLNESLRESIGIPMGLTIDVWYVYYSYAILGSRLDELHPVRPTDFEDQARAILNDAKVAIEDASILREADNELRERNYKRTRRLLESISSSADSSRLRHLSDACAGDGDFVSAEEYATQAIEADKAKKLPSYPGSFLRLAVALIGQGRIEDGLNAYRDAAKLGPTLRYGLAYARALVQHGNEDEIEEGIRKLRELAARNDLSDQDRSFCYVILARAEAKLGREREARQSIDNALDKDTGNPYASWDVISWR